jgi:hypothetical protein
VIREELSDSVETTGVGSRIWRLPCGHPITLPSECRTSREFERAGPGASTSLKSERAGRCRPASMPTCEPVSSAALQASCHLLSFQVRRLLAQRCPVKSLS